jgi:hypothetical protein
LSLSNAHTYKCEAPTCYIDRKVSFKNWYQQSAFSGTAYAYIIPNIQEKVGGVGRYQVRSRSRC